MNDFVSRALLHGSARPTNNINMNNKIYRIIRSASGWCVALLIGWHDNGAPIYHRVSNFYVHRGWAQAFARRMKISVQNYE